MPVLPLSQSLPDHLFIKKKKKKTSGFLPLLTNTFLLLLYNWGKGLDMKKAFVLKNGCVDNIKSILFHFKPAVLHASYTLLSDKDE